MNNRDILKQTSHRPFPVPEGKWLMKQIWQDLLFAHWPVKADRMVSLIPPGLELDLWEGDAWLTVSPFRLKGLRLRGLPPIPGASRFLEMNVRTYVVCNGIPGICFFSLDASKRIAVEAARRLHLPYLKARMSMAEKEGNFRFRSDRTDARAGSALFSAAYGAARQDVFHAKPGTRLHWLTERYRMYAADPDGSVLAVDIHHFPWPLQEAYLKTERNTVMDAIGLQTLESEPLLTYTERLDVLFWPMREIHSIVKANAVKQETPR